MTRARFTLSDSHLGMTLGEIAAPIGECELTKSAGVRRTFQPKPSQMRVHLTHCLLASRSSRPYSTMRIFSTSSMHE